MADTNSSFIKELLYPKVEKSLNDSDSMRTYKTIMDKYMARNITPYSSMGPSIRPAPISQSEVSEFLSITGITETDVKDCLGRIKGNASEWKNASNPYNIAIVLSIRYFTIKKNDAYVNTGLLYLITHIYYFMFGKYYKFAPNEAVMAYTIANLSQRFKVKKNSTILGTLIDITRTCYETHRDRLTRCQDMDVLKFINDVTSRINSFMRKLRNEFEENIKEGNYLQSEKDDYSEEHYYEADNDSFAIERITNKVLTNLVVNGPDRKLIELAAKNSSVSVNILQTSIMTLVNETHRDDIKRITECLLSLYLNDNNDPSASLKDIGTNKFFVYCIKVYRQSNTTNKNIIEIKEILDRWINELNLRSKVSTVASLGNYRKAIFTFFVFTIEKLN